MTVNCTSRVTGLGTQTRHVLVQGCVVAQPHPPPQLLQFWLVSTVCSSQCPWSSQTVLVRVSATMRQTFRVACSVSCVGTITVYSTCLVSITGFWTVNLTSR